MKELLDVYPTPFYLIDEAELAQSVATMKEAFLFARITYPFARIAYPLKANPLLAPYLYREHDLLLEASTAMELEMAMRIGEPGRIIFNGPYKPTNMLRIALQSGVHVNIDNREEFKCIYQLGEKYSVGMRVSPQTGSSYDALGFDLSTALAVAKAIQQELSLVGVHAHRSDIPTLKEYEQHVTAVFEFAAQLSGLQYVDIGSGFTVGWPYPLEVTWDVLSLQAYADVVKAAWQKAGLSDDIELIIEPGKRLVASCGSLLTRVVSIKHRGDRHICFVDTGHNALPGVDWCSHPVKPVESGSGCSLAFDIYGCICTDVLARNVLLENLRVGDVLQFGCVGAYDMARASVWQLPRPQVLWLNEYGHRLVRMSETVDYLWQLEVG